MSPSRWSAGLFPLCTIRTCADTLMGLVAPSIYKHHWLGMKWLPTGIIPGGHGTINFDGVHSRVLAHQLFDGLHAPHLAVDYASNGKHRLSTYGNYYAAYTSAIDLFKYDNLLFSGHLNVYLQYAQADHTTRNRRAARSRHGPG